MNRRKLLSTIGATGAAVALAGCAFSTVNGVTTVTLNVATINKYAQAIQITASGLLANPLVAAALGAKAALANALISAVGSDIEAFNTYSNGMALVKFDRTSVPAAFTSLENDAGTLLGYVKALAPSAIPSSVSAYVASLETIVELLLALASVVAAPKTPLTEAQALAVAGLE